MHNDLTSNALREREREREPRGRDEFKDRPKDRDRGKEKDKRRGSHNVFGNKSYFSQYNIPMWLLIWSVSLMCISFRQVRNFDMSYRSSYSSSSSSASSSLLPPSDYSSRADRMTLEIFTAPKPFVGKDALSMKRAIRSWQHLTPAPRITLLGWEVGFDEAANELGVNIDRNIDRNFLGVPLFNSMFEKANASKSSVAILINADILLYQDFINVLYKVAATFQDFLMVSARYDVDHLPPNLSEGSEIDLHALRQHVWGTGSLHTYGGMDVWAWNTDGPRLFNPIMPHFIFGRGKYDNWMTHETIVARRRHVVDVSESSLTVHVRHDYRFVTGGSGSGSHGIPPDHQQQQQHLRTTSHRLLGMATSEDQVNAFWSKGKKSKFELFINIYLSLHVGSYMNQLGNVLFAPWKIARCMESNGLCLVRRMRPGICNCEYSNFVRRTQTDPEVKKGTRVIRCGMVSEETKDNFTIPVVPPAGNVEPEAFGLPLTMQSVVEKVIINNTIVLTALNYGYKGMLMNWVCNMRRLNITNYVVAALDPDLYRFAWTRSLPTYLENTVFGTVDGGANSGGISAELLSNAIYGTDEFKKLTKMKSRVVLRLLTAGYNVIWTDCDIVYFKNPISDMWAYNADLVIQSNAPDDEEMNARRRLNSGLYLARSNERTLRGFHDVIAFASRSKMSEQPCFYDVLCGKKGERTVGSDGCRYDNGMTVRTLDRNWYPNGVTKGIWNTTDGQISTRFPELVALHNNWVKGDQKQPRFNQHGFVFYNNRTELCVYD